MTPTISTETATYDPKKRMMVMEASQVRVTPMRSVLKINLRSHRTGRVLPFEHVRTVRDGTPDNEVVAWVYENRDQNLELHILND